MKPCNCGSFAINPRHSGRDKESDLDLCDVCYWRKRSDGLLAALKGLLEWVKNWDCPFLHDGEWPASEEKIKAAITKAERTEGGRHE